MNENNGSNLTPYIEAAWGLRDRPNRGPKRGLSQEKIVEAAVAIAAAENLAAVSMSRVAADLGAATMSLYRYVKSKDELLLLMADAIYGRLPAASADPTEGWRAGLSQWAHEQHAIMRVHTWVLRIPIGGPPVSPNQIRWLERGLECLRDTGLAEHEKLSTMMLVSGFVRNEATVAADVTEQFLAASPDEQQAMMQYSSMIAKLADPERFPAFHRMIAAGVLDQPSGPDEEFVFGLERLLDGIDALVRKRKAERRRSRAK